MPILSDTGAISHGGRAVIRDDPAEFLPGWPGTAAVLQSRKVNFTLTNLGTTTKIYVGGIKNDIVALATFYAGLGATIDIEEGPTFKLTVTLPYDEFAELDRDPLKYALWEVTPTAVERDIFEVGIFAPQTQNGQILNYRRTVPQVIKGAVEQAAKNPMMTVNLTVKPELSSYQYLAENYLALKRLKADGVASFTQTVKRTLIVNTNSVNYVDPVSENPSNGNVNVLISSADLITVYNIPQSIQYHMLPSYKRLKSVTGVDGVTLVGLAGYLVKKPTYQQVTPNKIQLTQEFVWDEWLDSLYYPYQGDYSKFPQ